MAYEHGMGLPQNRVVTYALYNISASGDKSGDNKGKTNRNILINSMSDADIAAGQKLTREINKPGNLIREIDQFVNTTRVQ